MIDAARRLVGAVLTAVGEDILAQPVSLRRAMASPQASLLEPTPTVSANSVVQWHACTHRLFASSASGARGGYSERVNPLQGLVRHEEIAHFTCDIQTVTGLHSSKADLQSFVDLDAMATVCAANLIADISEEALCRSLNHQGIRILHGSESGDFLAHYAWDGRLLLMNSDGSHHFVAARYIAARLGRAVPVTGVLHSYSLDPVAVANLRREYAMLVVPGAWLPAIQDALSSYRATYLCTHLPDPYVGQHVVLLPRHELRAARAAAAMQKAGAPDLGEHLAMLVARQDLGLVVRHASLSPLGRRPPCP